MKALQPIDTPAAFEADGKFLHPELGKTFEVSSLPEKFFKWINEGRKSMYSQLQGQVGEPSFFSQHLPVIASWSAGSPFPVSLGNKGVGFLPKPEYLEESLELFQKAIMDSRNKTWEESMKLRLEAASEFYFDESKIDRRALSTLEIFSKTTYSNLTQNPFSSILYTGTNPDYVSFQVNAGVEIARPGDFRFEFVKLARGMFEYDSFHIAQPDFQCAYLFWILEVHDKSPFQRERPAYIEKTKGELEWEAGAIDMIGRAPGFVQQYIKKRIIAYAKERGFTMITEELVAEARKVLMR